MQSFEESIAKINIVISNYEIGIQSLSDLDNMFHVKFRLPILEKIAVVTDCPFNLCNVAFNMANEVFPCQEGVDSALKVYEKSSAISGGISITLSSMIEVANIIGVENVKLIINNAIDRTDDIQDIWDCIDAGINFDKNISRKCLIKSLKLCNSEQDLVDTKHDELKTILLKSDRHEIADELINKKLKKEIIYDVLGVYENEHEKYNKEKKENNIKHQWKDDEYYWEIKDPQTGFRYSIPYLDRFDAGYRKDYISYMKMRELNPREFERIMNWE